MSHKNRKPQPHKEDKSIFIPQRDKVKEELFIRTPFQFTEKQKQFIDLALNKNNKIIICNAPPGVGKTMLSIYCCLQMLNSKSLSQILYLRNPIEASSKGIGFIPGEKIVKLQAFGEPAYDQLKVFLNKSDLDKIQKEERVLVETVGFIQGRTFCNSGIIMDEAEDLSLKELRMVMSRMGAFSKLFLIGDERQKNVKNSGFRNVFNLFNDEESKSKGIVTFEFTKDDCMRSGLLKYILDKLEGYVPGETMFPEPLKC